MKRFILILAGILAFAHSGAFAANSSNGNLYVTPQTSVEVSSLTAVAGIGQVISSTPTAGTYSSGRFPYMTHVRIEMYATSTLTGGATPVTCNSTGISGNPRWEFPTAAATGTMYVVDSDYASPVAGSTANTAIVINCPSTASVIWNMHLFSYIDN